MLSLRNLKFLIKSLTLRLTFWVVNNRIELRSCHSYRPLTTIKNAISQTIAHKNA